MFVAVVLFCGSTITDVFPASVGVSQHPAGDVFQNA
jgi:hypothetical protein